MKPLAQWFARTKSVDPAENIVRMTRAAFDYLAPCFDAAPDFVAWHATRVYLDPRTRAVAYYIPGEAMPYGYVWERFEREFATEAKMLAQFVIDVAAL